MVNIFHLQPYAPPITVLGADQFAFPYKFILADLQLKRFWAWAETKTCLCWGRIAAKEFDEFQTNRIYNREHTKQKHQFYRVSHTINPNLFLEILKAVCLCFGWVTKLIKINFQTMEKKLVQRCETEGDKDACMASYMIYMVYIKVHRTM